jgi:DNA repair exonuclease SbcCD nuclease subunit
MVDFARDNGVKAILISGDLFDSDKPFKKDKDFFLSIVERNPSVDFLYLRGNHDEQGDGGEYPNLKTFSGEWQSYTYENLTISGIEIAGENASSLYSTLALDENKLNIVSLHGQTGAVSGVDKVNLTKLRGKFIDYLALGHIHEHAFGKLDERGVWAYSGCLEGRGFDETGRKGFVLLEIDDKIAPQFIPFSQNPIERLELTVTGLSDAYAVEQLARKEFTFLPSTIYRLVLKGEMDAQVDDLAKDVQKMLGGDCAYLSVKDETEKALHLEKYEGQVCVEWEFIQLVQGNKNLTEKQKKEVISMGLKALSGVRL